MGTGKNLGVLIEILPLWFAGAWSSRLINYGRESREGHRISTARAVVDCGPTGGADGEEAAYALDPDAARRCCSTRAVRYLNGELGKYTRWSTSESSQVLPVAA
jgi:hypothetical protein